MASNSAIRCAPSITIGVYGRPGVETITSVKTNVASNIWRNAE